EVLAEMLNAIKGSVKDDWKQVKDNANAFLTSRKSRLELLASLRIKGQITEEFFQMRLADEKDILESELHAIAILSKVGAQNAANAAIAVLEAAIKAALRL
ncbi:MAG: hypothetical protein K0S12_1127, partial [Bacteroidetes bacterium]|nr:hypothetical protein [Bacteroidota bacterium]